MRITSLLLLIAMSFFSKNSCYIYLSIYIYIYIYIYTYILFQRDLTLPLYKYLPFMEKKQLRTRLA